MYEHARQCDVSRQSHNLYLLLRQALERIKDLDSVCDSVDYKHLLEDERDLTNQLKEEIKTLSDALTEARRRENDLKDLKDIQHIKDLDCVRDSADYKHLLEDERHLTNQLKEEIRTLNEALTVDKEASRSSELRASTLEKKLANVTMERDQVIHTSLLT